MHSPNQSQGSANLQPCRGQPQLKVLDREDSGLLGPVRLNQRCGLSGVCFVGKFPGGYTCVLCTTTKCLWELCQARSLNTFMVISLETRPSQ